jgi:hypothetical protein
MVLALSGLRKIFYRLVVYLLLPGMPSREGFGFGEFF